MSQDIDGTAAVAVMRDARTRTGPRRLVTSALLLGLVTSALSGCVVVPVGGVGYRPEHGHWYVTRGYHRPSYYSGERYYYHYYGG